MPATETAIKGFAVQLVMIGYMGASLSKFFEAIIDRHRRFGVEMLVPTARIHAWVAAIQKQLGLPKREKFFVLPIHI
eukprot:1354549-Rhodomonas_salina.1